MATAGLLFVLGAAGCPTVDLGDTPSEIGLCNPAGGLPYFQDQIWPNFVLRNNAANSCWAANCHIAGGNGLDYPSAQQFDFMTAYRRTQIYLNCGNPSTSEFLTKPLAGTDAHGGGEVFPNLDDPAVQVFLGWFQ